MGTSDAHAALAATAYALWRTTLEAVLVCSRTPNAGSPFGALLEHIEHPRQGDLVLEISTRLRKVSPERVGELVRVEQRPVDFDWDEEWDEATEGRPVPTDAVHVVRTL